MAIVKKHSKGILATADNIKRLPGYFQFKEMETTTFEDITVSPFSKSPVNKWAKLSR